MMKSNSLSYAFIYFLIKKTAQFHTQIYYVHNKEPVQKNRNFTSITKMTLEFGKFGSKNMNMDKKNRLWFFI